MNENEVLYMLLVSLTDNTCATCPLLINDKEIPQCAALQKSELKFTNPNDIYVDKHPLCPLVKIKDSMILKGGIKDEK